MLGVAVLCVATTSRSEESVEGAACVTSADCGTLYCIDGVCHDVSAADLRRPSFGRRAMFGTGVGYGLMIAIVDGVVAASEPLLAFGSISQVSPNAELGTVLGVLAFALPALPASTTHFSHGRIVPGIISFFAWPSLAGTTFLVGGLFGLMFSSGYELNQAAAWAAGLVFGAAGAVGLTYLDVTMARTVVVSPPDVPKVALTLIPTRGGAITALGGRW